MALAFALLLGAHVPALAQSVEVLAGGLDNPRGLAFGSEGALYVAQAGTGGAGPCIVNSNDENVCLGATGRISRVWRGTVQDVLTGLPSLAGSGGNFATGPHDVSFQGRGNGFAVIGLGAAPADRGLLGEAGQWLAGAIRFQPSGHVSSDADIAELEDEVNPDEGARDTNPYAVLAVPGGHAVADAGGNAVWWVKSNGKASVLAVFPDRLATAPWGAEIPMQAVPNSLERGRDGTYYLGELTGFPFPVVARECIASFQARRRRSTPTALRTSSTWHSDPMAACMSWNLRQTAFSRTI